VAVKNLSISMTQPLDHNGIGANIIFLHTILLLSLYWKRIILWNICRDCRPTFKSINQSTKDLTFIS